MALILSQFDSVLLDDQNIRQQRGRYDLVGQPQLQPVLLFYFSQPSPALVEFPLLCRPWRGTSAPLIWEGYIRDTAILSCDGRAMYIYHDTWINEKRLADFKKMYPIR